MKRLKMALLALILALALCGCGKDLAHEAANKAIKEMVEEKAKEQDESPYFNVDGHDLLSDGYTAVSDVGYIKIIGTNTDSTVYIAYKIKDPNIAFFTMIETYEQLCPTKADQALHKVVFKTSWGTDGEIYTLDMSQKVADPAESMKASLPPDWETSIGDVIGTGKDYHSLVTTEVADIVQKDVEPIVGEFLAQFKESLTTLAQNTYTVQGQDIYLTLEQNDEGKPKFTLMGHANTEEEAKQMLAYIYGALEDGSMPSYSLSAFVDGTEMWAMVIKDFDGDYTLAGSNRDGSAAFFEFPDWFMEDTAVVDEEEFDSYLAEVQSAVLDFMENWQSYPAE